MGQSRKTTNLNLSKESLICCYIIITHYATYYTGITNSIVRRWHEHNAGKSSYLGRFKAKEVVHLEWFDSRIKAARKERYIKKIGAKKYLLKLKHTTTFQKNKVLQSM